jgi:hypothetical protein
MFHVADFQDVYTQKFFLHFWLALFEMGTDKIYAQTYGYDVSRKRSRMRNVCVQLIVQQIINVLSIIVTVCLED